MHTIDPCTWVRVPVLNVQILDSWQFEVQVQIQDFEVPVPGKLVNLVFQFFFDETTPNCSKAPLRWWELLAFKFWPSHFRAAAVISFFMVEHDGMPRTGVSYSAGCEISKTQSFCAFPSPTLTRLFLNFCTAVEREFYKLYFPPQLVLFLPCTFVQIPSLARPCILNLGAAGSNWQICRDHLVTN